MSANELAWEWKSARGRGRCDSCNCRFKKGELVLVGAYKSLYLWLCRPCTRATARILEERAEVNPNP